MSSFPCLVRSVSPAGETRYAVGDPLVDRYLEFVAGRCRPNTLTVETYYPYSLNCAKLPGGLDVDVDGGVALVTAVMKSPSNVANCTGECVSVTQTVTRRAAAERRAVRGSTRRRSGMWRPGTTAGRLRRSLTPATRMPAPAHRAIRQIWRQAHSSTGSAAVICRYTTDRPAAVGVNSVPSADRTTSTVIRTSPGPSDSAHSDGIQTGPRFASSAIQNASLTGNEK